MLVWCTCRVMNRTCVRWSTKMFMPWAFNCACIYHYMCTYRSTWAAKGGEKERLTSFQPSSKSDQVLTWNALLGYGQSVIHGKLVVLCVCIMDHPYHRSAFQIRTYADQLGWKWCSTGIICWLKRYFALHALLVFTIIGNCINFRYGVVSIVQTQVCSVVVPLTHCLSTVVHSCLYCFHLPLSLFLQDVAARHWLVLQVHREAC